MKKSVAFIIGIIICIVAIAVSYFWATALIDSVYAYQSPLHSTAPKPGGPISNTKTRSVVIVLIDGLRYDTSLNLDVMPNLNNLREEGAYALMHSRPPSYSQPGYAVILTGAWSDLNDAPLINLDYTDIPTFTQDDIFSAASRAGLKTAISGFNWFEKQIPQDVVTASFYTAGEDHVADRQVTDAVIPWLQEGKYQLVLIHLDQVDYAGHYEGGPFDPRWNEAATRADGLLNEITSAMDLNQDTLLVVSDHGHIERGGHGGQDSEILLEPFVLVGKGIVPGKYADVQMVDVAPTVAALLGTNIPATDQGQPRIEMLDITLDELDEINTNLSPQQGQLATAYGKAINESISIVQTGNVVSDTQTGMDAARESRLSTERIPRGIIGIILIIVILNLAAYHSRPHFSWILGGVVTYLVIFNLKYVFLDHKTYSLSSVTDSTSLIISTAITTSIALFIGWLLVFLGTRAYRLRSMQAADISLKFILATLATLVIPIFIHYIMNGAIVTWALPDFLLSFLGLIFLIQTMIVAVVGLILIGISAIIGLLSYKKLTNQEN
jgi:hypothetical protein